MARLGRRTGREVNHPDIARLPDELARAVAADAGSGLFLADTEDALGLVATHPVDAQEERRF